MSPWLQHTIFGIIALLALVSSFLVVSRRNPIYSALFLIVVFSTMAGVFLMLGAIFLGFMQLLVYAGAIMVLYLFVIMLINPREGDLPEEGGAADRSFAAGTALLVFCLLWFAIHESPVLQENPVVFPALPALPESHGGVAAFGMELFQEHLLVFELTSVLILIGIVGAVHMSIRGHRRRVAEDSAAEDGPVRSEEAARV